MWFILALIFALTSSLAVIIAKKLMHETDEYLYIWVSGIFTLPFIFLIILWFYQIPKFDQIFIAAISGSIILDIVAALAAYRAIKISEVSLIAPIAAFNPVFTTIVSLVVLGEAISFKGYMGILLICGGAYLLQLSTIKKGWLEPIKQLATHRGVQLSLLAYLIWSVTPILQKTAIFHTSPQVPPFISFSGLLGFTIVFTFLSVKFSKDRIRFIKKYYSWLLLTGFLVGIGQAAAITSFSLTQLGFATAVFKLSMIFTILLGWLFFKEHGLKDRLAGSVVMLLGVLLLVVK